MEWILSYSDRKIESPLVEETSRVVTLLVPENYYDQLSTENQLGLSKKLPYLLRRYAKFISATQRINSKAGTALYQDPAKMKRINFRVSSGDWSILGALAQAHGVSRCYLFNFLLALDEVGVGDSIVETVNAGVPTFHEYYSYIWHLDLAHNRISRQLKFSPNPIRTIYDTSFPWYQKFLTDQSTF
ncbi:DUF1564 domain-containing protein [Leptospira sanjuanensis]|uniref:DUF1564 domain-containing protein n=1 Tax=Leptospira sanjuanensis TaxID=2879643 RepID=UPI001EE86B0C|nr:DUF1564 domain-containing protein [Leptospira sanjuanensis]MCG6169346.1 DUF1564 domain-containing protein [Leptospira sanjuanensis]